MARYTDIEKALSKSDISVEDMTNLSKEYSSITPLVEHIKQLNQIYADIDEWTSIESEYNSQILSTTAANNSTTDNTEMKEMLEAATTELPILHKRSENTMREIKIMLLPQDKDDAKNVILEIRAGTGGEEASLFAQVLFGMYKSYAEKMSWKYEVMQSNITDLGGVKEVVVSIYGKNVFSKLKFESGVHRVQRVPVTDSSDRIHTSTATVAVLPEVEAIDVQIKDDDIRIDVFRASGPGGQSVNTTDSAVRITHIPTGIVVSQQDEKSQHKNKAKALKILQARVYEAERAKQMSSRSADRKDQVGTGDRSERIRTYNYHDNRVTDHRINFTLYKLTDVLSGALLHEVINALISEDSAMKLSHLE